MVTSSTFDDWKRNNGVLTTSALCETSWPQQLALAKLLYDEAYGSHPGFVADDRYIARRRDKKIQTVEPQIADYDAEKIVSWKGADEFDVVTLSAFLCALKLEKKLRLSRPTALGDGHARCGAYEYLWTDSSYHCSKRSVEVRIIPAHLQQRRMAYLQSHTLYHTPITISNSSALPFGEDYASYGTEKAAWKFFDKHVNPFEFSQIVPAFAFSVFWHMCHPALTCAAH